MANNSPEWRVVLNVLYDIIKDGLGRQVSQEGCYLVLMRNDITGPQDLNTTFFKVHPVTEDIANALYTDLTYGLKWRHNWFKWQFIISEDAAKRQAFDNELFSMFGLTRAQINEFRESFKQLYAETL